MAKISISIDDALYSQVRAEAGEAGVSAWLAEAASTRLRSQRLHALANEVAMETGGPFTDEEMSELNAWLGRSSTTPAG